MKNLFISLACLSVALSSVASSQGATFGYTAFSDNEPNLCYGTLIAETYDIAIAINRPELVGKTITSLSIPVIPSALIDDGNGNMVQNADSLSFWLSSQLSLQKVNGVNTNVPDIMVASVGVPTEFAEPNIWHNIVTYQLPEPVVIPESGLYAGYTIRVRKTDDTNATLRPIFVCEGPQEGGFFIHSSRTFRKWNDRSVEMGIVSWLGVGIEGDIPVCGARAANLETQYVATNTESVTTVTLTNMGASPIYSIDYTTTVNGVSGSYHTDLWEPIGATYLLEGTAQIKVPAIAQPGSFETTVTIDKINGEPNGYADNSCTGTMSAVGYLPKHRPLMEEFSGTGCGYCPRGIVGVEWMNEQHPDDFIAVVWHGFNTTDPMYPATGFPDGLFTSAPQAFFNRLYKTDPYYGDSDTFGIEDKWKSIQELFTPVDVDVTARWVDPENPTEIEVTSTINWAYLPADQSAEYRMEYILVGDDIYGYDNAWLQSNYFTGNTDGMPHMEGFGTSPQQVFGLHFNDVALMSSGIGGIEGSIPQVEVGVPTTHTFTFTPALAVNHSGTTIPYHNDRLRVVAVVLKTDGQFGEILNANRCYVTGITGITSVSADTDATDVKYFDLQGRLVEHPTKGIYIKAITTSSGTTQFEKTVVAE